MKILAIDSSGLVATVALLDENTTIAEYTVNYKKTHSETLVPMLDEIKHMVELDLSDIDAVAVAKGPGSFTGLRIGSATAKGLAYSLNIPIIEVPTVDALSYNAWGTGYIICPIMDARREQVYTGIYEFVDDEHYVILQQCAISVIELSDDTPSPGLAEFAHVERPVVVRPDGSPGVVEIWNRRHTADTADLELRWRVEHDGAPVAEGRAAVEGQDGRPVAAGERAVVGLLDDAALPPATPGAEVFLTVETVLREQTAWADAGHVVAREQWPLAVPAAVRAPRPRAVALADGPAVFRGPELVELAGAEVSAPRVELWRAPTDNDEGAAAGSYDAEDPTTLPWRGTPAPSVAERWRRQGLDRLVHRTVEVEETAERLRVLRRVSAAQSRAAIDVTETWTAERTGSGAVAAVLRVVLAPNDAWDDVWPRVGLHLELPTDVDGAGWFGLGPHDAYPDVRGSVHVGRHHAGIDDLTVPYARPQESGHRPEVRELVLERGGRPWLQVTAGRDAAGRLPGFTLARHSAHEIARAAHPHELPTPSRHHLYLDAGQHGLGSRACGPDVWPTAMLRPQARTLELRWHALDA